jgi:peroxiredoxin
MKPTKLIRFNLIAVLILTGGLVWIWLSRVPAGSAISSGIPAPRQGFTAPEFSLSSSTGELISLSSLRGKAVIVNVWASWCPPCQAEMPALQQVYQDYQARGLVILGVNATDQDDPAKAVLFSQEKGLSFPILFDLDGSVAHVYQVRALPTTFFIDPAGIIQEVVVGGPMSDALLHIRVENLLQGMP